MKALKITGAAVAVIILIGAALLAFGLPLGFVTSAIQDRVERDTGYRLTIAGSTRVQLWPSVTATLSDLTVQDPKDRDGNNRLTIARVKAELTLKSLLSGRPELTDLTIEKPMLYLPLYRERLRDIPPRNRATPSAQASPVRIARVTVNDGAVILSNPRDRIEDRLDGISAKAELSDDSKISVTGNARAGERPVTFEIKADAPVTSGERQTLPLAFTIAAPGTLKAPLTGRADLRLSGRTVMINSLSGMLDDGAFNGWASVDVSSKPLVKLDLDFQRLEIASATTGSANRAAGWSTAPIDLRSLNYVDAQARLSAAKLTVSGAQLGPAAIEATLAGGVLKTTVSNLAAYDGQASGEIIVDASSGNPAYAMHCDLTGVRALPLLQNLADFDRLDSKLQAKLALRASGASQQAIMSSLSGSAFVLLQDGAIRGINVAQMIRSLTSATLSGWQDSKELSTDLTQLSASFKIERGQAATADLNLVGPLVKVTGGGTIDLGKRAVAMRVEPKLVMTTQGQGRMSDPIGLGIPVVIDGPWTGPRIYPDMAGILDNPDAAYARLKQMGQGLFGKDNATIDNLLSGLGGLIGNATSNGPATTPQAPAPGAPAAPNSQPPTQTDPLGGQLGAAIGNLIQQGLQQQGLQPQQGGRSRGRTLVPEGSAQTAPAPETTPAAPQDNARDEPQDSQPMNDVLKRLFNR